LLYWGGRISVGIEKQDAAGVVVERKVEATSSADVLAKVTISLGVIPWKKYYWLHFLRFYQPLRLTLKVVMVVEAMEVEAMEVEAITEVAGIMEIMGETLGGGG
jgi:hypothetical protein